jgi:hypothetical protein
MFYIPYCRIQLKSKLKTDEIERRLNEQLGPFSPVSGILRGNHKYFQGSLENGNFKINRIINYRNSFKPVIIGRFQPEIDHTVIDLTLRLDYVVMALLIFFMFAILTNFILQSFSILFQLLFYGGSIELIKYFSGSDWIRLLVMSVGIFLYPVTMIGFNIEANKALNYLDDLFENQMNLQQIQ